MIKPTRFAIGDYPEANISILFYAPDGEPTKRDKEDYKKTQLDYTRKWRYEVRFHCCGEEDILAHRAIKLRFEGKKSACRLCALKLKRRNIAGEEPFIDVPWPAASTAKPRA